MARRLAGALAAALALVAPSGAARAQAFDRQGWLADLAQMQAAFTTKYANLDWAQFDAPVPLSDLIAQTRDRVNRAGSDAEARAAFDRLIRRLGDGHVELDWPSALPAAAAAPSTTERDPCAKYDASRAASPLMVFARDYAPLETADSPIFPAGLLSVAGRRVGVLQIGAFGAQASPPLCRAALAALAITPTTPCDDACHDRIDGRADAAFTAAFARQIEALARKKADVLLIDVAGNGGGSEWFEAAARMVTSRPLASGGRRFVRGEHWTGRLDALAGKLRADAAVALPEDRPMLLRFAGEAAAQAQAARTPCDASPVWSGRRPACPRLVEGFSATGPLVAADPDTLRGKAWAADVFTPMEFPYRVGIWRGPLVVLVDGATSSAAEGFAAELQDGRSATIVGDPTYGAGGGHTEGGTPTRLSHSGAVLQVPDFVSYRADGEDTIRGVEPDLLVGFRRNDGPRLRAAMVIERLAAYLSGADGLAAATPPRRRGG